MSDFFNISSALYVYDESLHVISKPTLTKIT